VADAAPVDLPHAVRQLHNAMTSLHHSQGCPSEENICQEISYNHGSVSKVLIDAYCPDWTLFYRIVTYLRGDLGQLYPFWAAARVAQWLWQDGLRHLPDLVNGSDRIGTVVPQPTSRSANIIMKLPAPPPPPNASGPEWIEGPEASGTPEQMVQFAELWYARLAQRWGTSDG
jgi:hypothetical protein